MGTTIWDIPIRWSHTPSKEEREAAGQPEREERARLDDATRDDGENDAPRRFGGSRTW